LEKIEMKKTLVAVAALVATGAFAQVSITGVMEASVAKTSSGTSFGSGTNG